MSRDRSVMPFIRWHELSPEAIAYQARRKPSVPIEMPDPADHAAVADWRAATNALWGEDDDPAVPHRREVIGGVACRVAGPPTTVGPPSASESATAARPASAADVPTVVYAHGGGYVLGSAAVAIPITARLGASGLRVVSVDYRQPPEHPFPAALDDVLAVYLAFAAGDTPVALAGDSAGGALVLSAAVTATHQDLQPFAITLFSPLLDLVSVPGNPHTDDEGRRLIDYYVGDADPADPRLSPLRADLSGLPPVLVHAGADEPLAAQAREFQRKAVAAGVEIKLGLWEHMWHTWHYHDLPEADQALAEAAVFLAAQLTPAEM